MQIFIIFFCKVKNWNIWRRNEKKEKEKDNKSNRGKNKGDKNDNITKNVLHEKIEINENVELKCEIMTMKLFTMTKETLANL